MAKLIAELNRVSPEFRELWTQHDVYSTSEGRKAIIHPLVGKLSFDLLSLQTVDSGDLRIQPYTPRSSTRTADKIERLLMLEAEANALSRAT